MMEPELSIYLDRPATIKWYKDRIEIFKDKTADNGDLALKRAIIENAINANQYVSFRYQSPGNSAETRFVRPEEVYESSQGDLILYSYDLDRAAPREFRLDRILGPVWLAFNGKTGPVSDGSFG